MARGHPEVLVLALLAIACVFQLPSAFVGVQTAATTSNRVAKTQRRGYRLDWMLFKDGPEKTSDLETQDGYFIGERGFMKSQAAQGLRYRMRPTSEEYKLNAEGVTDELMFQLGPIKLKLGEAFGGTANNDALRTLKQKIWDEGLTDPKKIAENEYWLERYGYKRWASYQPDVSENRPGFFRGLGAWSGFDPLNEQGHKNVGWYGRILTKAGGYRSNPEQFALEEASGKIGYLQPARPPTADQSEPEGTEDVPSPR